MVQFAHLLECQCDPQILLLPAPLFSLTVRASAGSLVFLLLVLFVAVPKTILCPFVSIADLLANPFLADVGQVLRGDPRVASNDPLELRPWPTPAPQYVWLLIMQA